jgi:hypothetical protein
MEIDLAILADAATVDVAGKLNILGIFDRSSVQDFPAQHSHLSLVLRISASVDEAGHHTMQIVLRDPDGAKMMKMGGDLHVGPGSALAGGQIRIPQVLNIGRLVFPKGGQYAFDVSLDGEHHVSIPLIVHGRGKTPPAARA